MLDTSKLVKFHVGNRKMSGLESLDDIAPEIALVYAVLERSILDASGILAGGPTIEKARALKWLLRESPDDYHVEFSFVWCCEHLNCDPLTTRKRVLKLIRNGKANRAASYSWQALAKLLQDESPSMGDYDVYCESESLLEDDDEINNIK